MLQRFDITYTASMSKLLPMLFGTACTLACAPPSNPSDGPHVDTKALRVTVVKGGDGLGGVVSDPEGIDCSTDCTDAARDFAIGGNVVLVAEAARDALFGGWACTKNGNPERNTQDASIVAALPNDDEGDEIVCTANFRQLHTLLVVFSAPNGADLGIGNVTSAALRNDGTPRIDCSTDGNGDCQAGYFADESDTLTATAAAGSTFCGWRICGTGTGPVTVTLDDERNCEAVFASGACP